MGKIGRNQPCPCGSGLKYKKCCLKNKTVTTTAEQQEQKKVSITEEVQKLQQIAATKKESINMIGVFILLTTSSGDGWLLELTQKDAVLVAKDGTAIDIEIEESAETIEINWSHQFTIEKAKFKTTAYADKQEETHPNIPASIIKDALRQIEKTFSSDLLNSIHVDDKQE